MELTSWIKFTLERGSTKQAFKDKGVGIRLNIKARAGVEEFIKQLSGGRTTTVDAYGDAWHSEDENPLEVYILDDVEHADNYTLLAVGAPLLQYPSVPRRNSLSSLNEVSNQKTIANLSVLRLVGISKPEGVTIGVQGMYSGGYVQTLRTQFPAVTKQFLQDYIVPITLNLEIVSKDV